MKHLLAMTLVAGLLGCGRASQKESSPLDGHALRKEVSLDGKTLIIEGRWNARAKERGQILCESEPQIIHVTNFGERSTPQDGQRVRVTATFHWYETPPGGNKDDRGFTIAVPPDGYYIYWVDARWEEIRNK